jgi:hypothetical protein
VLTACPSDVVQLAAGPGEDAGACLHLAIKIIVEELEEEACEDLAAFVPQVCNCQSTHRLYHDRSEQKAQRHCYGCIGTDACCAASELRRRISSANTRTPYYPVHE